jgi:hypothetical protein
MPVNPTWVVDSNTNTAVPAFVVNLAAPPTGAYSHPPNHPLPPGPRLSGSESHPSSSSGAQYEPPPSGPYRERSRSRSPRRDDPRRYAPRGPRYGR